MRRTIISARGQVTIPAELRKQLEIQPGTRITWFEEKGRRFKQKHRVGYADAFAAELAIERGACLATANPEFSKIGQALSIYSLPRHEK